MGCPCRTVFIAGLGSGQNSSWTRNRPRWLPLVVDGRLIQPAQSANTSSRLLNPTWKAASVMLAVSFCRLSHAHLPSTNICTKPEICDAAPIDEVVFVHASALINEVQFHTELVKDYALTFIYPGYLKMYWEEGATKVINQEVSSGLCTKLFSIDLPCLVNLADSDKHYPGILSYLVTLEGDEGPEM
jgi:hypothetical protein